MEAEQVLRELAAETGMEVVIIRPPLVYGPGVKAISLYTTFFLFEINNLRVHIFHALLWLTLYKSTT